MMSDPRPAPELAMIVALRDKKNMYRHNFFIDRGIGLILMLWVGITSIPSNIESAPPHEVRTVIIALNIGVLGIVPGVLTLYEFEQASAAVSIAPFGTTYTHLGDMIWSTFSSSGAISDGSTPHDRAIGSNIA
jgi:L-serine deaminase